MVRIAYHAASAPVYHTACLIVKHAGHAYAIAGAHFTCDANLSSVSMTSTHLGKSGCTDPHDAACCDNGSTCSS